MNPVIFFAFQGAHGAGLYREAAEAVSERNSIRKNA